MSEPADLAGSYELTPLEEVKDAQRTYRVYQRRWVVLVLFMMFGIITAMSWIQYAIVANVMMRYYNVSSHAIDWTAMIFMLTYIPLIFPALIVLDMKGLRFTILVGTFGCAVGTCIKMAAVNPDRFAVAFVGQTLVGMSEVFLLSVPPRLAAVWFGADQVSTACSLGACGTQIGIAMGFLIPPLLIHNHAEIEDIGRDLATLSYGMAAYSTALFVLVVLFFKDSPPVPPSVAQLVQQESTNSGSFLATIKRLMRNRGYVMLLIAYGICMGVMNALFTLLNQLIMTYFENGEQFAGRVGLVTTLSGLLGSVVSGVVLDKTHKYKETTVALFVFALAGMMSFSAVLGSGSQLLVYLTSSVLGCCLGGVLPVGFELAMELTYPEAQGTAAGVL